MAFKNVSHEVKSYESIESLFRDIRTKKIDALYSHQADLLKKYENEFMTSKDVALELPTGSGKTLIGLLIGEYHRRINSKKVVFLCSTNQLVNQVVELANNKYGIKATPFTGSSHSYGAKEKTEYLTGSSIAVTNYSSVFNVNPFFKDPDLLIFDDAHVAENYIASNWSVNIIREDHPEIYSGLLSHLKPGLDYLEYARLSENYIDPMEINTVQLIPQHTLHSLHPAIVDYLNSVLTRESGSSEFYHWSNIKDHLTACQIYITWKGILIRPFIPPTQKIQAFSTAKQRVYMSATLGACGDLERIFGVRKIDRLPLPTGWDKQGSGRRFFVFPEMSLNEDETKELFVEANKLFDRSLSLVPDFKRLDYWKNVIEEELKYEIFGASDIEKSKARFTTSKNSAAIVANRYEGIDFAGDECRILFIVNLSKTVNLQEVFLSQRMGSQVVLLDRIRTRITQAIGRCTRGASDWSCVIIMGEDIGEYFINKDFRKYFHPELQAEIHFGILQSKEMEVPTIVENINIFKEQGNAWRDAEASIFQFREVSSQAEIPGSSELSNSVFHEVEYQYAMWNKDYGRASELAQVAINNLSGGKHLNGYRGFWNYLAAVASYFAFKELGLKEFEEKSKAFLTEASKCSISLSWLRKLSLVNNSKYDRINDWDDSLVANIEKVEEVFIEYGIANTTRFENELKSIEEGLRSNNAEHFERAQVKLGIFLGFSSIKSSIKGAPDPYWISNNKICFVFEDYTDSKGNVIPIAKARQAFCHPQWIMENVKIPGLEIYSVLVSDSDTLDQDAKSLTDGVYFYKLGDFRTWAQNAIQILRTIRGSFSTGSAIWREFAMEHFIKAKLDPQSIVNHIKAFPLRNF